MSKFHRVLIKREVAKETPPSNPSWCEQQFGQSLVVLQPMIFHECYIRSWFLPTSFTVSSKNDSHRQSEANISIYSYIYIYIYISIWIYTYTHIVDRIFIHSSLVSSISPMRLVLRGLIPWSPIADHPKAAEAPRKEEGNSDSAGESKVHDYLNWLSIVRLDVACETSTGFKQFHKKWVCNTTDFPKPPPYSPCHYQRRWF